MNQPQDGLRGLAKDAIIYGIADFAPRAVNFALLPLMTRFLSPKDYGILSLVQMVSSIAEILFHCGAETAFSRFYPEAKAESEKNLLLRSIYLQLILQGILGSLILSLLLPYALPILFGAEPLPFWPYGFAAIFLPLLYLTSSIALLQARMERKPKFYLWFRLATFGISILGIIYFVVVKKHGAWGSLKGQMFAAALSAVALLWIFKSQLFQKRIDWATISRSVRYGFPLFSSQASNWFFAFSDRIFIQRYRTTETVGMYQMGSNFLLPMDFLINAINFAWTPRFFHQSIGKKDYESLTRDSLKIVGAVFVGIVGYMAFLRPLITLMTFESFHIAYRIGDILAFYYATRILWCVISNGLSVHDRTGTIARVTLITGIAQVASNFFLISRFGALGAAFSTVTAGIVRTVVGGIPFVKTWPVQLPLKAFFFFCLCVTLAGGTILIIDFQSSSPWNLSALALKLAIFVGVYHASRYLGFMIPILSILPPSLRKRFKG